MISLEPTGLQSQTYKWDLRTCAIFIPAWNSNWGSSQARMSPASTAVWAVKIKHVARRVKIVNSFILRLFLHEWPAKTRRPPIWVPWLTTPIHRVIYKVRDLHCISVFAVFLKGIPVKLYFISHWILRKSTIYSQYEIHTWSTKINSTKAKTLVVF